MRRIRRLTYLFAPLSVLTWIYFSQAPGAAFLSVAPAAVPTSGFGTTSVVQARGSFVDSTDIKLKVNAGSEQVIHVADAGENVIQQIIIAPGGHTGWHSHPGPVVVLVKSGALTFYSGDDPTCTGRTYTAGQAFIDSGQGHVHIARNESSTQTLELWALYFDLATGGSTRIDAPAPGNCPF